MREQGKPDRPEPEPMTAEEQDWLHEHVLLPYLRERMQQEREAREAREREAKG